MQRIAVASGTSTLREGYCLHLCLSCEVFSKDELSDSIDQTENIDSHAIASVLAERNSHQI
jgi:hypothetical protein